MELRNAISNLIYSGDMQSGLNQIVLSHLCMEKKIKNQKLLFLGEKIFL